MSNSRIILAANRLPVSLTVNDDGFEFHPSPGGLASAVGSLGANHELVWVGWPGELDPNQVNKEELTETLSKEFNAYPILLNRRQLNRYYFGFSNRALWPVLHYLPVYLRFDERDWRAYEEVNRIFADQIIAVYKQGNGDDVIWVHDYQLMLVPAMLREALPDAKIGFFLHTPFPSSEMFRTLPHREKLLKGLLGATLIGFHTYGYVRHFRSALLHILGIDSELNAVELDSHQIQMGAFPISIDRERIEDIAYAPERKSDLEVVRKLVRGRKLILSVDRLDYTKGLPERLRAYKKFLEKNPERAKDTVLVQIAVPSRTKIPAYQKLKDEVEQIILDIEESFEDETDSPIHFMYRSLPVERLFAFYREAHVALVTPYFDGMNLVAKEYVAVKKDYGVLILSEHAGAAAELGEALIINPWNPDQISESLTWALDMDAEEQKNRMGAMYKKISRNDVHYWASSYLKTLEEVEAHNPAYGDPCVPMTREIATNILHAFAEAPKRLIFLDYDGTLAHLQSTPELARPDAELLKLLNNLAELPNTHVIVISGRSRKELENWLGHLPLGFSAEHGLWIRFPQEDEWHNSLPEQYNAHWYEDVKNIFYEFNLKTPGSFTEEKEVALAWHYRLSDPTFGRNQSRELVALLDNILANQPVEVLSGKMVVETRVQGIHKGNIIQRMATLGLHYDFMMAMGDDTTDEHLFEALPEDAFSVKVGAGLTYAKYRVRTVDDVRQLLGNFLEK